MNNVYYFNLIYRCNQNCKFCFSHTTQKNEHMRGELSVKDFQAILEKLDIGQQDRIVLNGGEPTLHQNFKSILETATSTSAEVVVYTNGTLLSLPNIRDVINNSHLNRITIPIHGHELTHDEITQTKGSYARTIKGLVGLLPTTRRNKLELKFVITTKMFETNFNILKWIKENRLLDASSVVIAGQVETPKSRHNKMKLLINNATGEFIGDQIVELLQTFPSIKLYDICIKTLPVSLRGKIVTLRKQMPISYQHIFFFDNKEQNGREVSFSDSKLPCKCTMCSYKSYCKRICHSYNVLKISNGYTQLVLE